MKEELLKESPTAVYDRNKRYKWEPNTTFTLNGEEFGVILNSVRSILASEEAKRILLIDRANSFIEEIMKRSVEAGVVKEDIKK